MYYYEQREKKIRKNRSLFPISGTNKSPHGHDCLKRKIEKIISVTVNYIISLMQNFQNKDNREKR